MMRTLTFGATTISCSCNAKTRECVCHRKPQGTYDISMKDLNACMKHEDDHRAIQCVMSRGYIHKPAYAP